MNKLSNISDNFKNNLESYNDNSDNPFSLSAIAAKTGLKKLVGGTLLFVALATSFNVQAHDVSQFESEIKISQVQNENHELLDISELIERYDIDIGENNASQNIIDTLENNRPLNSPYIHSGVYKNPFEEGFVTIIFPDDIDSKRRVERDYRQLSFNSEIVQELYVQADGQLSILKNGSLPNYSFEYASEDIFGEIIEKDDYIKPSFVFLDQEMDFFTLDNNENSKEYNDYFILMHEIHHSAATNLVLNFENQTDIEDTFFSPISLYDKEQEKNIEDIESTTEYSADFAAAFKLAQYMKNNGETNDEINKAFDKIIEVRNKSIDGTHYSVPVLAIAKETFNKNPDFVLNINNEELFELSLNVSNVAIRHDYKNDYLYKVKNSDDGNTNSFFHLNSITNGEIQDISEVALDDTKLSTDLRPSKLQSLCAHMDLESKESIFPNLSEKIGKQFKELGLQNSLEENNILNNLSENSEGESPTVRNVPSRDKIKNKI